MKKQVIYNGRTKRQSGCTNPSVLKKGKIYEVIGENVKLFRTYYTLKGVEGQFNSVWFEEIPNYPETFLAIGITVPSPGESCFLYALEEIDEIAKFGYRNTSTVQSVEPIGNKTFRVVTENSIYILQII